MFYFSATSKNLRNFVFQYQLESTTGSPCCLCGGGNNTIFSMRKQRFPVNSITSKLVLKSIYASGSTGPFFDNHFMNKHDSSFAKKTDFLSRYLVLSEIRCARKKSNQKQEQNLLSKVFNLSEIFEIAEQEFLLDSLLSA